MVGVRVQKVGVRRQNIRVKKCETVVGIIRWDT